jgi:hypothetical protein
MTRDQRKDAFEAIGMLSIVASLIFLALEVRQSNLATLIDARDSAAQGHIEYLSLGIDTDTLMHAIEKTLNESPVELTGLEKLSLETMVRVLWRHYDRLYFLYRSGVYTEAEWTGYESALVSNWSKDANWIDRNIIQPNWEESKRALSPDFADYVDSLARRARGDIR